MRPAVARRCAPSRGARWQGSPEGRPRWPYSRGPASGACALKRPVCRVWLRHNGAVAGGPVVRLFGPVTVVTAGHRTSAGGPRQAGVLAVLAMNVGRPVSVDRLIDAVWGEEPPSSVTNAVQVHVSALRTLLRPTGMAIERVGSSYSLVASLDDVDVELFQRHAAEGRAALRALEPERALSALERAWDLWDATPFAGLDECTFVVGARAALLSSGLSVAVDRGSALCALGRSDDAAAAAEQLVGAHPFYEPAWDLLMRALYHAGRQHDALMAYARARTMFVDELGLDPPSSLVELERQVLDRALEPIVVRAVAPAVPVGEPASVPLQRLPERPTGMIGREAEIEQAVRASLADARLITLVGLGGIGKTTIALAVGHRLAAAGSAVAFADLAAAADPATAMERMCEAAAIGSGSDAALRLAEADPELVLIADNAEQVAGFPAAVAALLARTIRLRLIVTSRVALRIRAEHVLQVLPMDATTDGRIGDAGALLIARARMLGAQLDVVAQHDAIVEICELAGGIPLAIEIAAGRLNHLTPHALAERLRRQRAALLDGQGAADLPERQQRLRTVLDATSTLLSDRAGVLARRLCVVKGPVSLGLLERTFEDDPDLVGHLGELVDASLVNGPDATDRYRMPIPVSEYFADGHPGLADEHGRILRSVLAMAESLVSRLDERGRWAEGRLLDDAAAVTVACDAAIAQRDADAGARLVVALRRYWLVGSRLREALQFCELVAELDPAASDQASVQLVLGQFAAMVNRPDAADLLTGGIRMAEATPGGDAHLLVNSWCYLGSWMCDRGDHAGARQAAARVGVLAGASGDPTLVEVSRDFAAYVASQSGDHETAARLGAESLIDARRRGDRYVVIDLLTRTAENLLELERFAEADPLIEEAMEIARTTPIGPLAAKVIQIRAAVDIELGRLSTAIGAALEALRLTATSYPDPVTQASALRTLAVAWCAAGDLEASARCDGAATAILEHASALVATENLSDRRLRTMREAPQARSVARIAARDPDVVVQSILARTDA